MDVMSLFKQSYSGRLQEIMTEIQNRKRFSCKTFCMVTNLVMVGLMVMRYGGLDHVLASR